LIVSCRLEPQKNVTQIIEAFHLAQLGDRGWTLDIYGGGSEENRISTLIDSLDLKDSVQLKGEKPRNAISYAESRFTISNSSFEGSPNSLHEAVSQGCIPIASSRVREFVHLGTGTVLERLTFSGGTRALAGILEELTAGGVNLDKLQQEVTSIFSRYWSRANVNYREFIEELSMRT